MHDSFRFDHAIITVGNLETAIENYRSLGFTVIRGGRHAAGTTHNALIVLSDGSYLELIALTYEEPPEGNQAPDFRSFFTMGMGLVGYALYTSGLEQRVSNMQEKGINIPDPRAGQRKREDGKVLRWLMTGVSNGICPLLIQDITPRNLRLSFTQETTTHQNGVVGVDCITVLTRSLRLGITYFKRLLDVTPLTDHHAAHFLIGSSRLIVAEPTDDDMQEHLDSYDGSIPYQIDMKASKSSPRGLLDQTQTGGVRLQLV